MSREYGLNHESLLSDITHFDICSGALVSDIVHDLLEGIVLYETKLLLKRFLERHYFKLKTFNKVIEVLELPVGAEPSQPAPVPRKVLIAQHNHLNQKGKDIATAITVWIINITLYFMHNVAYCK